MERIADEVLLPIAPRDSALAWYRGHRLMALDGTLLDLPDFAEVANFYGYPSPSKGDSALPQARILSLVEIGTHAVVGARIAPNRTSEQQMADAKLLAKLQKDMLLLANRNFYSYWLWKEGSKKANLLWRIKSNLNLPKERRLSDGSFLSSVHDGKNVADKEPIQVRVIEYTLKNGKSPSGIYRLITTLLDHTNYPAEELASLYHGHCEVGASFGEIKASFNGRQTLIRSRTPELIKQEIWGLLIAHFAIRSLMSAAGWVSDNDPGKLNILNSIRIVKRKLPHGAVPPTYEEKTPK